MNTITKNTKITSSDINTLISECNNKLSLSGGTITGVIHFSVTNPIRRNVDNSYLEFFGATTYKNGAFLRLDGKDGPNAGGFKLQTGNGTTNKVLHGKPDGTLTWNGHNVITSAGGFLTAPLTGQQIATIGADVRSMFIGGANGLNENAPLLCFDGSNGDSPGRWYLLASNGSQKSWLMGYPNGALELNGSPVLTSAGGTIYAPLYFYGIGSAYYGGDASSESMNVGLVEENVGRSAVLSLRTSRATDAPGSFWLGARNASSNCYLTGTADGWLGWCGQTIVRSVNGVAADTSGNVSIGTNGHTAPNFGSSTSLSQNVTHTISSNGFVYLETYLHNGGIMPITITLNGSSLNVNQRDYSYTNLLIPVKKSDRFYYNMGTDFKEIVCKFFPAR